MLQSVQHRPKKLGVNQLIESEVIDGKSDFIR